MGKLVSLIAPITTERAKERLGAAETAFEDARRARADGKVDADTLRKARDAFDDARDIYVEAQLREQEAAEAEDRRERAAKEKELDELVALATTPLEAALAEEAARGRELLDELVALSRRVDAKHKERRSHVGNAERLASELGVSIRVKDPALWNEFESAFQRALGSFSSTQRAEIDTARQLVAPWFWEGR